MAVKSISISEETYNRLISLKHENESLDDLIVRLTHRGVLRSLIGLISEEDSNKLKEEIENIKKRRIEGYSNSIDELDI